MVEDRSLDEFAAAADSDRDDTDPESEGEIRDRADDGTNETVTATATWTAGGADCDRCGEPHSRRWRDGDALVCADCKDWSE